MDVKNVSFAKDVEFCRPFHFLGPFTRGLKAHPAGKAQSDLILVQLCLLELKRFK